MAEEPARTTEVAGPRPAVECGLQANKEGVTVWLKIDDKPLVRGVAAMIGVALGVFYIRNSDRVESAIKSAFAGLCQVVNITRGSILVELYCDTEQSFLLFMEAFETKHVKQRLEEELQKVGFNEELEVTITNNKEIYDKLNRIR